MNRIKPLVSSITLAALAGIVAPVAWTGPAPPPPPTMQISVAPAAQSEPVSAAAGDAKFITFTINLSNIQGSDIGKTVKVTWGVTPGTATAADYEVPAGSKTLSHKIVAGDVGGVYVLGTPTIGVKYDVACEGPEGFTLDLSSPQDALLSTTTAAGSITDTVVPIDFVIDDATADEDAGTLDLTVRVQSAEQPVANSVTLDYSVSTGGPGDTAEDPEDMTATTGTVTVSRLGLKYTGTISVPINKDLDADHEKFTVTLSTSTCGQVVSDGTAVATINDLDAPVVIADCGIFNGHPYKGGSIFFEFFRYLTGRDLYRAHTGGTDFDGGEKCSGDEGDLNLEKETYSTRDEANATNIDGDAVPAEGRLAWDASVQADPGNTDNTTKYVSPLDASNACGSIYTVNLLFGVTQNDPVTLGSTAKAEMTNPEFCAVDSPEGQCTGYDLGDDNYQDLTAQLAGWMKDHELMPNVAGDQNVTSFFIVEQQQEGSQQIQDYAAAGKYGADGASKDSSERAAALYTWDAPGGSAGNDSGAAGVVGLLNAIDAAIGDIVSKSATFVSASVPVDVFNRASVRDELYIALFQVGRDTDPLNPEVLVDWPGNLKKLKLQQTTVNGSTTFSIVDSLGNRGVDPAEGRIDTNALTFWTDPAALPSTIPCFVAEGEEPATGKDGRAVCIGAAGQNIPGFLKTPGNSAQGNPGLLNPTTDLPPNTVAERQGARNLLTQLPTDPGAPSNPGTLLPLNANATTVNALHDSDGAGANYFDNPVSGVDATRALALLCHARGLTDCASGTAREWIFGDVLHSRPLPINYGDRLGCATQTGFNFNSNPDIRILTGTNDGYLHMFQNTLQSNCSQPATQLGIENWAFMPLQLVSNLQQLKLGTEGAFAGKFNAKQLNIEGYTTPYHPYGVDGEPTVYTDPGADGKTIEYGDGDKAYVFFGLRRGGKGYYGLDISNPDSPSILWALNGTDATRSITATPGFEELGMSFSKPSKARVNFDGSVRNVLVFGGGYYGGYARDGNGDVIRPGYDYDDGNGVDGDEAPLLKADTDGDNDIDGSDGAFVEGNAIYVVDMETGALLWKAVDKDSTVSTDGGTGVVYADESRLDHSIVAEVAMLDSDGDGIDDRAYVGDLGGNVWRVDLPPRPTGETTDWRAKWGVRLLASLGGSGADDRRFYHRADVVLSRDPTTNAQFDAVLIGSGDRENAKGTVVQDHFYMLKDNALGPDAGVGGSEVIMDELANADCFLPNNDPLYPGDVNCVVGTNDGWRLDLGNPGEKILAPSITVSNEVFFTSYLPEGELDAQGAQDICAPFEGNGRLYAVGLLTGAPINPDWSVGNEDTLDSADRYQKLTSTGIPSELVPLGPGQFLKPDLTTEKTKGSSHWKTYWYEKGVDL